MILLERTQVLDFKAFCRGEIVIKNKRRKKIYKQVIELGALTLIIYSFTPLPVEAQEAIAVIAQQAEPGHIAAFQNIVNKLLEILDWLAKLFGIIAGIAIMTGNGRIGLERLFWLSIGYITCNNVGSWIEFLKTI